MSSGDLDIRTATAADAGAILALNAESVWAMSPLDQSGLQHLLGMDGLSLVADRSGEVLGFAISLVPNQPYESVLYRWFAQRSSEFLYLDRVAVVASARRQGVASALYDRLEVEALPRGRIFCEVNVQPPNPVSLAFHEARGFTRIATFEYAAAKIVAMLERRLIADETQRSG